MTDVSAATKDRTKLALRLGSSHKLLARKAMERAAEELGEGAALEASFPKASDVQVTVESVDECAPGNEVLADADDGPENELPAQIVRADECVTAAPDGATASPVPIGTLPPPSTPLWSSEDESALRALLARRKAAGHQRRGRDVGGQLVAVGSIAPNPGTIVAVIAGIVADAGSMGRAELIGAMAAAQFPHAKAQPTDKSWCQGYVAGAIRNGFLALVQQPAVAAEV